MSIYRHILPLRLFFLLFLMVFLTSNGCAWRKELYEDAIFLEKDNHQNEIEIKEEKDREEVILPGDKLYIKVKEDNEYGGIINVSSNGYILLPLIDEIKVTSLLPSELAQIIIERLENDYFHKATVTVIHYDKQSVKKEEKEEAEVGRVYVLGEVSKPGAINISKDEAITVAKAIIAAGGFTEYAKQNEVKLVRIDENNKRQVKFINVGEILREGRFEKDILVKDGDWIIVEESFF